MVVHYSTIWANSKGGITHLNQSTGHLLMLESWSAISRSNTTSTPVFLSAESIWEKKSVACKTHILFYLVWLWWAGKWKKEKTQGQAAKDVKKDIYMQPQQVSASQIRALGALCRVLSQVWRGRIALVIPRLHKVWTKYAANLFRAELEGENRNMRLAHLHPLFLVLDFQYSSFVHFGVLHSLDYITLILPCKSSVSSTDQHVSSTGLRVSSFHWIDAASKGSSCNLRNSITSQGQRESVSVGTGITDLGGIGKTSSKQVYYIWRAIFTASTKRTQKVLYLTIWDS